MESAACGLLAARNIYARLEGKEPARTAHRHHVRCAHPVSHHREQTLPAHGREHGILPPLPEDQRPRDKRLRYMAVAERAVASFQQWLDENNF